MNNKCFLTIALASKLDDVEPDSHEKYLKNPTSNLFLFQLVTKKQFPQIFYNIPNKNSTGVDDFSTF